MADEEFFVERPDPDRRRVHPEATPARLEIDHGVPCPDAMVPSSEDSQHLLRLVARGGLAQRPIAVGHQRVRGHDQNRPPTFASEGVHGGRPLQPGQGHRPLGHALPDLHRKIGVVDTRRNGPMGEAGGLEQSTTPRRGRRQHEFRDVGRRVAGPFSGCSG